ncbi:hypothetical protein EBT16_13850 [bacterium]|nr:hypothetical protein [bacterium]
MREEADLSSIEKSSPRAQRIKNVFNRLVATAQKSQASLLDWLSSEKIKARSYYISNMIVAEDVSRAQMEKIAKRDDVMEIVGNPEVKLQLPSGSRVSDENPRGPGANLVRFGASKVWDEFKVQGENIVVSHAVHR